MYINIYLEIILISFPILASNGFIYSLKFFNLNKPSTFKNISVITPKTETDVLAPTLLIASNPLKLTSSESSASSESNLSQEIFDYEDADIDVSQVIFDYEDEDIDEGTMTQTQNSNLSDTNEEIMDQNSNLSDINEEIMDQSPNFRLCSAEEGTIPSNLDPLDHYTSLDSITILNSQKVEEWRDIVLDLHDFPINTPAHILQQIKFEEINIIYSQDIIQYAITQTELRLLIELLPAISLFKPEINHLILTMMAYYHL